MKLTALQLDLLTLLGRCDRFGITDGRVARALERKGLAKYFPKHQAATILAKGRKVLHRLNEQQPQ